MSHEPNGTDSDDLPPGDPADWRDRLAHDGAAVIPRLLGGAAVRDALAAVGPIDDGSADDGSADTARPRRRGGSAGRRNVLDAPGVAAVAADPAVRAVVEAVLGPDARPVRGLLFDKTPAANWTVPWHQDRSIAVRERLDALGFGPWSVKAGVPHVQPPVAVLAAMLTVRLHLDDCGPDNGPLRVVPGTHRRLLDAAEVDAAASAGPRVALTCPAGGAVVMRPLVLHASSPATSPRHRRVLHLEYAATGLPGGLAWRFG